MDDPGTRDRDWWCRQLEARLGTPFTTGNRIELLRNGDEIFPAMLAAIRDSRHRVELLTFVWWGGDIVHEFARALAERARAGVTVRVVLDEFGAKSADDDLLDDMRAAGVDLRLFRPRARWKVWEAGHRCHRRVLVCDGVVAFTGGVGIAEEWTGDARDEGEWRDTHARVEGPAVAGLRGAFHDTWDELATPDGPIDAPVQATAGDVPIQVIRGAGEVAQSDVATLFGVLFSLARRTIRLSTAYLVPDEAHGGLLCAAAQRGVQVDLVVPGPHVDKRVGQLAGEEEYAALLDAGVRIHSFQPSMLHAKVLTIDGEVGVVGTANLNARSMSLDQEIELVVADQRVVAELDRDLDADIARSRPAEPPTGLRRVVAEATDIIDDAV